VSINFVDKTQNVNLYTNAAAYIKPRVIRKYTNLQGAQSRKDMQSTESKSPAASTLV